MTTPFKEEEGGHTNAAFESDDPVLSKEQELIDTNSAGKKKKQKKNKKDMKESDEEEEPALPPVSLTSLFRFASRSDIVLNVIAIVVAIGSSLGSPVLLVLFGDVTNSFVGNGLNDTVLRELQCNPNFTIDYNITFVFNIIYLLYFWVNS